MFLWCSLQGLRVCACAPTGIAAANIAIEGTDIGATTIHNLFNFRTDLDTNFDFTKEENPRLQQLAAMDVLLVDESIDRTTSLAPAITPVVMSSAEVWADSVRYSGAAVSSSTVDACCETTSIDMAQFAAAQRRCESCECHNSEARGRSPARAQTPS